MNFLDLTAALVGHLAWPTTLLLTFYLLRKPIKDALPRIASLKHGDTEITFSEISKAIIENKPSEQEKSKLVCHQIVSQRNWDHGYYRLYSNGVLVQRFKTTVAVHRDKIWVTLPIAFPNEITNIQLIGDLDIKFQEITSTGFTVSNVNLSLGGEVEFIVSGL